MIFTFVLWYLGVLATQAAAVTVLDDALVFLFAEAGQAAVFSLL